MNLESLTPGHKIAGGAGALALINMFLPWYGLSGDLGEWGDAMGIDTSLNAWQSAFAAWGGSLLLIAAATILLLKAVGKADVGSGSVKTEQIALGLASLGAFFIVLRVVTQSEMAKVGLWLGLLLAATTVFGTFTAMKEQGLSLPSMDELKSLSGDKEPTS